ncbi:MAG: hypothetical protein AABX72_05225, partial [Nanoarchaeota archaeon]
TLDFYTGDRPLLIPVLAEEGGSDACPDGLPDKVCEATGNAFMFVLEKARTAALNDCHKQQNECITDYYQACISICMENDPPCSATIGTEGSLCKIADDGCKIVQLDWECTASGKLTLSCDCSLVKPTPPKQPQHGGNQ